MGYCAGWATLFYACVAISIPLRRILPKSSVEGENNVLWIGWNMYVVIQSSLISWMSLNALFDTSHTDRGVWWRPPADKFANQNEVARAGLLFTSFEIVDLTVLGLHGLLPRAFAIHHVIFACLGVF